MKLKDKGCLEKRITISSEIQKKTGMTELEKFNYQVLPSIAVMLSRNSAPNPQPG